MTSRFLALRTALRSNRGSSVVMVLVCMLCVSILGVTLLYMSYTGLKIKVTERQGKETFYSAAAAADEVRAGMQQVVSDAIADAYKTVLVHYSSPNYAAGSTMTLRFQEEFRKAVWAWQTAGSERLFSGSGSAYTYAPAVLADFLSPAGAANTTVGLRDGTTADARYDETEGVIVLKNLLVRHTDPATGFVSSIATDLSIAMPDFYYILSEYSISGLPEFAVIANESLEQTVGITQLQIDGSAYAGRIELSGAGSSLKVEGGALICRNAVSVTDAGPGNGPRFTVAEDATLWAERIRLGSSGSAALLGSTYVYDDLELAGTGSSAKLEGNYFGFGYATDDATRSSAIVVNGRDTTLDLSGLSRLMLAGHSFVTNASQVSGTALSVSEVLMGESVAVRSNQQAYLVPAELLDGVSVNPTVEPADDVTLQDTRPLWNTGKTLADYHVTLKPVRIPLPGGGGQHITYYFMDFADVEDANAYFEDYFTTHQAQISDYLNLYTDLTHTTGISQTSGYTLEKDAEGDYSLRSYVERDTFATAAQQMEDTFGRLITTLFSQDIVNDTLTPYDHFVDTDRIEELPDNHTYFTNDAGETVALIVKGDYTLDTPGDLRVIIATGSVTVNSRFDGLIISGETITMKESVYARQTDVTSAFSSTHTVTDPLTGANTSTPLSYYLRTDISDSHAGVTGGITSWNLNDMVQFSNWTKD